MEEKKKKTTKKVVSKKKITKEKAIQSTKKENINAKWYVLNIRNGYENSIQKELRQRAEATGMEDEIVDILVPVQKKIFVKKGKQEVREEKIFPGYILIKMELNNKTWDLVQNTEGVRGFVKTDRYPKPLAESEVQAITKFMEVEQPSFQTSFSVGEAVKITEGAFADFIGSVQEIDTTKGKIKVLISFLGREAPVELELSQVTKL
ncbi:transcription termination/antitermination factor NusG [Candidatus Dojkabacteria bacterium]|uniref:Transcription termination/antitermination protein NusG n=1 Tax=Candidatus Dojkabacteria bacterium TaxID=2099670 RepID=A0A847CZN1_9BACT|nr:transcription termination/antitermination factor NusG [Candidatus Dojkabacteria bacterium]NLD25062.1 transcription termination/antitermination factor NusG [Candidatus Dojkabacteria bacterium]HNW33077.1 transcription termination/antitermination protein NusG [Candidatus Dojkabacteria bacterium]HOZ44773.1 transcription termination/antitermination protein NusG [Candidatus Dojkabacteria bacterium]HPR91872.1 transcription termination/antitermination protein NusG [Candidatus Dojkabacteria bacterium